MFYLATFMNFVRHFTVSGGFYRCLSEFSPKNRADFIANIAKDPVKKD